MHQPDHLFSTAEEVRIRAGLNGVCKITMAFVVGGTDGWGLPPRTEDCVPDFSDSHGRINTEICRQFLSCFDWQPEMIGNQFVSYFVCYSGFSGKFQPLKLRKCSNKEFI